MILFILESTTHKYLQDTGLLDFYKRHEKLIHCAGAQLDHYFQTVWNQIGLLVQKIWTLLFPLRAWINATIPPILEKIEKDYWPSALTTLKWLLTLINDNLLVVRESIDKLVVNVGMWLQQNVLIGPIAPENLQHSMVKAVEAGRYYLVQTYTWAHDQFKILIN